MKMYPIVNLNQLLMHAVGDNLGKGVPLYRFIAYLSIFSLSRQTICPSLKQDY